MKKIKLTRNILFDKNKVYNFLGVHRSVMVQKH
jgi:hypothetical protein